MAASMLTHESEAELRYLQQIERKQTATINERKLEIGVLEHDHRCGSDGVCHYCAYGLDHCVTCGKPLEDREHRGVQTHEFRSVLSAQRLSAVDELPVMVERRASGQSLAQATAAMGMSVQQAAVAMGQLVGAQLRDLPPRERPRDPNCCPSRPRRHRRFPLAWWRRRCRCHECHRKPDHAHIEAMERECRIRNEEGELVWPDPKVGDQDRHGRTVVCVGPEGEVTWDRAAPPTPPSRYEGERSWV